MVGTGKGGTGTGGTGKSVTGKDRTGKGGTGKCGTGKGEGKVMDSASCYYLLRRPELLLIAVV